MKNLLILSLALISCNTANNNQERQTSSQDDYTLLGKCEGCEAVFEYGDKSLDEVDTLPAFREYPEDRIKITGTIYMHNSKVPAKDVILYIYSTNPGGEYASRKGDTGWAKRHGYNRGWIKTGASGKYTFFEVLKWKK